jgi:hypothetical protein
LLDFFDYGGEGRTCRESDVRCACFGIADGCGFTNTFRSTSDENMFPSEIVFGRVDVGVGVMAGGCEVNPWLAC